MADKTPTLFLEDDFKVYVVGGGYQYLQMFLRQGYDGAKGLDDCDIVCFTGGEDVHPSLYGEVLLPRTYSNITRDKREVAIYHRCVEAGIPMVGICRGAQFLNVMNGGKLWQDVNNHGIYGTHPAQDYMYNKTVDVTSTHHQMMIPNVDEALVLMTASMSTMKWSEQGRINLPNNENDDVEAVWYEDTKSLCFQPHPEMDEDDGPCQSIFVDYMNDLIIPAFKKEEVVN
jgi:gamma-glutamyl-gamma-aminobutyrate hydrolase PuuD